MRILLAKQANDLQVNDYVAFEDNTRLTFRRVLQRKHPLPDSPETVRFIVGTGHDPQEIEFLWDDLVLTRCER